MFSRFPFSMENIPRQTGMGCLSLKFGTILSALFIILYSVLSLAQCSATIADLSPNLNADDLETLTTFGVVVTVTIVHAITLLLSAVMLVGALRDKAQLIRPWVVWTSIQVMVYVILFVYSTTMSMINHLGESSLLLYALQFLTLLMRFYMLMLVSSYCKELEEEQYGGERLKTLVNNEMWYNSA